jgi:cytidyltransferase-like protein
VEYQKVEEEYNYVVYKVKKTSMSSNVFISGYFDPCHVGHIDYVRQAKELADSRGGKLIVCVNNENQTVSKKGREFMPAVERLTIVQSIRYVDHAFLSVDADRSVCESLRFANKKWGVGSVANGGDRNNGEVPEGKVCRELGIEMVDGLGDKIQSSSNLTGLKALR